MTTTEVDRRHMTAALSLARRGLGRTWPNPAVGCVLVKDGRVVGRGFTQPGGRPHAETEALRRAGTAARGATAYISLEPCAHHGETPSCAVALVEAGIARAVVAIEDPDPRTAGKGLARLRDAGIAVATGVCQEKATALNAGFLSRVTRQRPLVTLKVAATLDGRVAAASGDARWITGETARRHGHMLRADHDAIMVGSGTVLADDPALTCRLGGLEEASPVRIVADSALRTPPDSLLVRSIPVSPLWILCGQAPDAARAAPLRGAGAEIMEVRRGDDGRLDLPAAMLRLAECGLTRVLVEGGPALGTALLRAGLVDRLAWFVAPRILGGDARAAIGTLELAAAADAIALAPVSLARVGDDTMLSLDLASIRKDV